MRRYRLNGEERYCLALFLAVVIFMILLSLMSGRMPL